MSRHPLWPNGLRMEIDDVGLFHCNGNGMVGYHIGAVETICRDVVVVHPGAEYGYEDAVCWVPPGAAALLSWEFVMDIHDASAAIAALERIGVAVPSALAEAAA